MRSRLFPPVPALVGALTDSAAIATFTIAGIVSHDRGLSLRAFAEDVVPLLSGWLVVAAVTGLYQVRSPRSLLMTWLLGIPLGVALRAAGLGRLEEPRQLSFLATTLLLTLVVVAAARIGLDAVSRPRT